MPENSVYVKKINKFKNSLEYKLKVDGERYYRGDHDILNRVRTVINKDGVHEPVNNLINNKVVDNQYQKMVDQKVNYQFGKPFTIDTKNEQYAEALKGIFNNKWHRTLKNIAMDSINGGIAWLYPYYDDNGQFTFKTFEPYECIPIWKDTKHTILDYFIRCYRVEEDDNSISEYVEVYTINGMQEFKRNSMLGLMPLREGVSYIKDSEGKPYNWERLPIIPFKFNPKEIPLIKKVKSLQDGINKIKSNFENNMEEDVRNTIMVLVNYDGESLETFRHNLSTYGVIPVTSQEGGSGDVKTLQIEVNAENYKVILDLFKKALIENARGFDAKSDVLGNNPNQMNIQSMYSDIDLDASGCETEFKASLEELMWFVNTHLANTGQGNYFNETVDFIFNKDILINESETIDNIAKSIGIVSNETLLSMHPYVKDVKAELERLNKEKEEAMEQYNLNPINPRTITGDPNAEN